MPSALSHDPQITVPGASTDNAVVIFDGTGGTGFGNSTILVDSGGNGRIGIAADTDIITVTAETVTIAGKLVATSIDVGDGAVTVDVTQSNHSLTVGMPIKVTGANQYAAAQANSAANAEVVGIVTSVASSSAFTMTLAGEVTTATAVPDSTSPGDIVYLSASSAGAVTTTEPSTAGQVSKPIGVITEANNKMIMLPFRGEVISSATDSMDLNGTELVLDVDADTSITADTDDQIDIRLSGADDFQFTANTFSALGGSSLKFFDSDNSNYFTLAPNATTTANIDYTWPAAGPASNGHALTSTTAGVLSWAAAGGSQTPWTGNIDGANYTLSNVGDAGNDWTANTLVLQHDAAGAQMQFKMYNTSSSAGSSAAFKTRSMSGTGDPVIEFEVTSGGQFLMGIDNSNGDLCVLGGHGQGLGGNDTFRVTQGTPPVLSLNTGLGSNFDYVCSNCGNHGLEMFTCCGEVEWHDDVLALRKAGVDLATMANPYAIGQSLNIAHLVKLGVMNYDDKEEDSEALANRKTPWLGINISNGLMFTWAGMWQTRELVDTQYKELKDTIKELKAEIATLRG